MIFITNPKDHSCRIFILISDRSIDKADRQNKSNQVTVWTLITTTVRLAALQGSYTKHQLKTIQKIKQKL